MNAYDIIIKPVITAAPDANVVKSGRNIAGCQVTFADVINVYDIVNANKLVVDKALQFFHSGRINFYFCCPPYNISW